MSLTFVKYMAMAIFGLGLVTALPEVEGDIEKAIFPCFIVENTEREVAPDGNILFEALITKNRDCDYINMAFTSRPSPAPMAVITSLEHTKIERGTRPQGRFYVRTVISPPQDSPAYVQISAFHQTPRGNFIWTAIDNFIVENGVIR